MSKRQLPPDRVSSYFRAESGVLVVITVTGLLYNIGLVAGPWFEGQMTEALARILLGEGSFSVMVSLAAGYIVETRAEGRRRSYQLTAEGETLLQNEVERLQAQVRDYEKLFVR